MKKRITALVLAIFMVLGTVALAAGTEKSITVTPMTLNINGQQVTPTKSDGKAAEVFSYDGATYVPLRYLSELLDIQVEWDKNDPDTAKLVGEGLKAPTQGTVSFTPGEYKASAAGRNGDVTVTATFSAGMIESISTDSRETPTIGVTAMAQLTETIIANQSLAVDAITGATLSCEAYLKALIDCVEQAGGNVAALKNHTVAAEVMNYNTSADIIVVGAGGAGMTAALTASEAGASVILLEKSNSVGGNTLCAANGINAYDADVQLANEAYQKADTSFDGFVALQTNERSRDNLVRTFISNSAEAINYISGLGVDFTVEISNDDRNSSQNYYLLKAESNGNTTMINVINALDKALSESDVELYKNVEATELVQDSTGAVVGVKAVDTSGRELTFSGKSVILCTGGFGKNSELVGKVNPRLANATTDELAPTTGDGLIMAQAIGAKAVDLDQIQTFPAVIPDYGMVLPPFLPGGFQPDCIYVNNSAQRFTVEGFEIPDAILAQDKGEAFCIFKEENLSGGLRPAVESGFVVKDDSVEELARKLGLDAAALRTTVDKWNADCAAGADSQFGRTHKLNAIDGTLYGYKFGVGAHYFMGGILINENTQVLNENEQPIPGLYAAGEVTGGFHGTQRVDGSGTGDAIVFGRIAGEKAAGK